VTGELAGKVAIVTGASSGIGLGTSERFLEEGAKVVLADVDRERGEELVKGLGSDAAFRQVDVASMTDLTDLVDFAVQTFGGLDVMVNNAGISGIRHTSLFDDDFADFHRVMGVNLLGVMAGTREAARHMSTDGGGSIINMSSVGGIQPGPSQWAYQTSKAAIITFTKSSAIDLGRFAIRVNCIAPGNIETPILEQTMVSHLPAEEREEAMAKIRAIIISRQPLQRQGTTDDIAEAALYFASDRSSYVTGTLLPVDGGLIAGSPRPAGLESLRKPPKSGTRAGGIAMTPCWRPDT
jgi:NAD(P)-dependent dehydrogenase (short-subunit alcohol dehydrogenase family)